MLVTLVSTAPPTPVQAPPAPAPAPDVPKDTPYQRIKNSKAGKFVRENKVLTGVAATGGAIVLAGAVNRFPGLESVVEYGVVPAIGAGAAVLGAAAVHDAIVNDIGKHNLRATAKISLGTLGALGGTQVVGMAYDIPVLDRALSGTVEKIGDHGLAVLGVGVLGGAAAAGKFAASRAKAAIANSDHRAGNAALAVTAGGASAAGVLGGLELIGRQYNIPGMNQALTRTVEVLASGGLGSVAGGALLVGGAGVLVDEALRNVRKGGNDVLTVVEGMGAVTAGLGGLELIGHGLKVDALQGLLTHHAATVGSVAMAGVGGALAKVSLKDMQSKGLTLTNTAGATAGGAMVAAGAGLTAYTFGFSKAAEVAGRGAGLVGGIGLGAATYVLGRNAVRQFRNGDILTGAASSAGAAASATGSLLLTGEALGIDAISRVGREVAKHTLEPLWDHVLEPIGSFLYNNPIAGGVVLAVGVGAYIWYRSRK
ncbi:MAG: hypothetical protein FJX76_15630 [Armatimonadetes bacterium]|nr:hypothetical protein [Armatimonadota bacterium]